MIDFKKELDKAKGAAEAEQNLATGAEIIRFARSKDFRTIKEFIAFLKTLEGIEDEVLKYSSKAKQPEPVKGTRAKRPLDPKKLEIVRKLKAQGKNKSQISNESGIAAMTVKKYWDAIEAGEA